MIKIKKIIPTLMLASISTLVFSQSLNKTAIKVTLPTSPSIIGQYDVCTNSNGTNCYDAGSRSYVYTLNGVSIPAQATNINVGWDINSLDGVICNATNVYNNLSADIMFYEYSCNANATVRVNYVSYDYAGTNYTTSYPNLFLSINDLTMGSMGAIAGATSIFYSNTNQTTYSIPPVCGANYYEWNISGSGWTVDPSTPLTGSAATTIKVNPSATSNCLISVSAWLDAGKTCGYNKTQSININRPVEQPTYINPISQICLDNTPSMIYNINAVPNALSYTWIFPTGWTGVVASNGLSASVNFNPQVPLANICVKANFIGGISSQANCINVMTASGAPFAPGYSPTLSSSTTPSINKWNVQIIFPSIVGGNYNWSTKIGKWIGTGYTFNSLNIHNGVGAGTSGYILANHDRVYIDAQRINPCAVSVGNSYVYEILNGAFTPVILPKNAKTSVMPDIEDIAIENFKVFPNPAKSNLNVSCFTEVNSNLNVVITDILGNIIIKENRYLNEGNNEFQIQLSELSNGIYFLNLESESFSKKEKIVIEK